MDKFSSAPPKKTPPKQRDPLEEDKYDQGRDKKLYLDFKDDDTLTTSR